MDEPREVHPIQFFNQDSKLMFDQDLSFTPERVVEEETAGQPEPLHDPMPPQGPVIPVPAPDAEPIPTPTPEMKTPQIGPSLIPSMAVVRTEQIA